MTTNEDDPFGRGDRTIVRPNPAGRLTPPPANAPDAAKAPGVQPAPPLPEPAPHPAPSFSAPSPPFPALARAPPPSRELGDWDEQTKVPSARNLHTGPETEPLRTAAPVSPDVSNDLVTVAASPLMRASASLLLLLGRLRTSLARAGAGQLMDQVAEAIRQFEADARAAGAPVDQIETAKYALAACADDIAQNLPSEDSRVWTQRGMLVRFFNERMGGVRFFSELDRAKQNPAVDIGLLEIMHACLSLGFEGAHRESGGPGALRAIRRDLYETISSVQPKTIGELSPHWRGRNIPLADSRLQVPVWAVAAAAGVILLGTYLYLRNSLSAGAEALALKIEQVHPNSEVDIVRATPVKPPPDPQPRASIQLQRIRGALAKEILTGQLEAVQSATTIFVRIGSKMLFPPGGAKVNASFLPIAAKIGAVLDREPGPIHVDGYTDSDPIRTVAFPSNFALSEARAKSVASILKSSLSQPSRLAVSGKGAETPIAPNDTEQNKSKNRRVEVSIPRAE
jgi:type VI secretion system protein ImpK